MTNQEQQCHFWHKADRPNSIFAQPENYVQNIEDGIVFAEFQAALAVALSSVYGFERDSFEIVDAHVAEDQAGLEAEIIFTEEGVIMAKLRDMIT